MPTLIVAFGALRGAPGAAQSGLFETKGLR